MQDEKWKKQPWILTLPSKTVLTAEWIAFSKSQRIFFKFCVVGPRLSLINLERRTKKDSYEQISLDGKYPKATGIQLPP